MKAYFQLQIKILNRRMIDFGLPILIGYTILPFVFVLLSNYLFEKTEFANYVYGLSALIFISKLSEPKRNDFLKSIFNTYNYKKLRIVENLIYCLPFTLFLIYQKQFVFSIVLNLCVIIIMLFNFSANLNAVIPTPFGKKPFEFTAGFRKSFYVFPIAYFLTYISVSVGNFNLGIFSMLLIGIICFSYYSKIENDYFVWNYNLSPKEFLIEKKSPLSMPPSFEELPVPSNEKIDQESQINNIESLITENNNNETTGSMWAQNCSYLNFRYQNRRWLNERGQLVRLQYLLKRGYPHANIALL